MIPDAIMLGMTILTNLVHCYRIIYPAQSQKQINTPPIASGHNTQLHHAMHIEGADIVTQNFYAPSSVLHNTNNGASAYDSEQEYLKNAKVYLRDVTAIISQYCKSNKYYLAALGIASSYGYLYYKVHTIKSYISNPHTWSTWMQDVSFEKLLSIPQDKLTHDLIAAIQARYASPQNPTDSLAPLIEFSKDIEKEKQLITTYHTYISWSTQFSLQKIIPFSNTLLSQITERKQRIIYISTLFQTWLTHNKL